MDNIDQARIAKEHYITTKVNEIVDQFNKDTFSIKISTCDHFNWDREYHRCFNHISDRLKGMGYVVSCSVNHGVSDWVITV